MSDGWKVTIPGQPPSTNHAYKVVRIKRGNGYFSTLAKTEEAVAYQTAAKLIVAAAKPTGWAPGKDIHIAYRFYLTKSQDVDNSLKILNDAIARALGVNDSRFLPCVQSREIVGSNDARVEVTIK